MPNANCAARAENAQQQNEKTTGARLVDYSPQDRVWDVHRAQAQTVEALYRSTEFDGLAGRVRGCSGFLGFAWENNNETGESHLRLREARFCRVRYCPVCQWRRSLMHKARFLESLPSVLEQHPKARFLFLTLTVRNCQISELRQQLGEMNKSWHRLVKRQEFKTIIGWIRSTEVTRGVDGSAHPHFHILLMVRPGYFKGGNYIKQERWTELWAECAKLDYVPVVDIRAIKGNVERATAETLKYSAKPSDLVADAEWLVELTRQTHKLRFMATGGILKNAISEQEKSEEELLLLEQNNDDDDAEKSKLYFDWHRVSRHYEKR